MRYVFRHQSTYSVSSEYEHKSDYSYEMEILANFDEYFRTCMPYHLKTVNRSLPPNVRRILKSGRSLVRLCQFFRLCHIIRSTLITAYKICHGYLNLPLEAFFHVPALSPCRGHRFKIRQPRFQLARR